MNSRLDTLQAAVLLEKMKIFDWELKEKNIIVKDYLRELEGYYKLPLIPKGSNSAWAQFTLQTKNRKKVISYLKEKNSCSNILSYSNAHATSL